MKTIESNYSGNLRIESTHVKSSKALTTDAPVDNNGKGDSFSPTDLVATALLNCMMTVMGIKADQHKWNILAMDGKAIKHMASNPRRISKLEIEISCKLESATQKAQTILEQTALNCPVAKSISTDIDCQIQINFSA